MARLTQAVESVCVFCGSSDAAAPAYLQAAAELGKAIAGARLKLIYGGGGVGLMGACARAASDAGGAVLGIIPDFLVGRERALETIDHVVVGNMHERKMLMFQSADAFVVLPGGVGTLEEVVELLSWRRLELHAKPVVFFNPDGFWRPLFGYSHGIMIVNRFYENVSRARMEGRALAPGEKDENVALEFKPDSGGDMLVACLWSRWTAKDQPDLLSFAAITDEPPVEVAAAGHDRCIVPVKPENVQAWLNPNPSNLDALYAILDDRDRFYYEHRLAA